MQGELIVGAATDARQLRHVIFERQDARRAAHFAHWHGPPQTGAQVHRGAARRYEDYGGQLFGGLGGGRGMTVERLYREIRALRIYEGASEVQRMVIARSILKEGKA